MSKQKREQQKKRKREKARKERKKRLVILRATQNTDSEDEHCSYFNMDIYDTPKKANPPLSPEMDDITEEANDLVHRGNYKQALTMLEKVNAKEPGRPMVLYNIAVCHLGLGDNEYYDVIIDKLVKDFPDYFFGQVAYAIRLIAKCQLDEAWDILRPICGLKRLHISEYRGLAGAMILLNLAKENVSNARDIYQSVAYVCEDPLPSLDSFLLELIHCRAYYSNRN